MRILILLRGNREYFSHHAWHSYFKLYINPRESILVDHLELNFIYAFKDH